MNRVKRYQTLLIRSREVLTTLGSQKYIKQLSKFLFYALGRRPDEFGLVPDPNGFVKIKTLLKAVSEEDGWKYVRRSHIEELLIVLPDPPVELKGNLIRAKSRNNLPLPTRIDRPPTSLFTCIRRKAYPRVIDKGISPSGAGDVILSSKQQMAMRIGKRIDQKPVLLTIQTGKAAGKGVRFYRTGDLIYIAASIPPGCFTGPAPPKAKEVTKKQSPEKEEKKADLSGSFILAFDDEKDLQKKLTRKKRQKEIAWKKDRKRLKHARDKMWPV